MVMVIFGPSPVGAVPPIYLSGSFGLVRPAWIIHALGRASKYGGAHPTDLPAQVSARVRPIPFAAHARRAPGGSRCCIIKPPLAVGLGFFGVSVRNRTAPVALILGRVSVLPLPLAAPSSPLRHPRCTLTDWSHSYPLLLILCFRDLPPGYGYGFKLSLHLQHRSPTSLPPGSRGVRMGHGQCAARTRFGSIGFVTRSRVVSCVVITRAARPKTSECAA